MNKKIIELKKENLKYNLLKLQYFTLGFPFLSLSPFSFNLSYLEIEQSVIVVVFAHTEYLSPALAKIVWNILHFGPQLQSHFLSLSPIARRSVALTQVKCQ